MLSWRSVVWPSLLVALTSRCVALTSRRYTTVPDQGKAKAYEPATRVGRGAPLRYIREEGRQVVEGRGVGGWCGDAAGGDSVSGAKVDKVGHPAPPGL